MLDVCNPVVSSTDQLCATLLTTVGDAPYVIGGKWTLQVIIALSHGHKRFNELPRTIDGISSDV